MAAADTTQPNIYFLTLDVVRWGIAELRNHKIHPFYLAYLQLRKQAAIQGSTSDITPHWDELAEYLAVAGGPPGKPFFRPTWHRDVEPSGLWLNPNIAGSYAPSSIRGVPRKVVDVDGSDYSLLPDHAQLARDHLLYGEPVSPIALAAFVYRDFGFVMDGDTDFEQEALESTVRKDWRFADSDPDFSLLFDVGAVSKGPPLDLWVNSDEWLEDKE